MNIETFTSVFIGVLGLVTGYYFYRKSLREKMPCWSIKSNVLVQDNIARLEGVEISYNGQKVENLVISRILFWNNGSETIDSQDIALANPPAIVGVDGVKLLDA